MTPSQPTPPKKARRRAKPKLSRLHKPGWSAVRSMVKRRETNAVMDELWELGARGILVTDIHACRL